MVGANSVNDQIDSVRDKMAARSSSTFEPTELISTERFVEAFVASLVHNGWKSLAPQDPATRRGLAKVVSLLDSAIEDFDQRGTPWKEVAPWVRIANSLRPSPMGGVENWEYQLRSAQGFLTRVSNPSYEIVDLAIAPATADYELQKLSDAQRRLVDKAVNVFKSESAAEAHS